MSIDLRQVDPGRRRLHVAILFCINNISLDDHPLTSYYANDSRRRYHAPAQQHELVRLEKYRIEIFSDAVMVGLVEQKHALVAQYFNTCLLQRALV